MTRLRVHNFGVSLDGYGAGPGQDPDHPLGVGGEVLHQWAFATRAFRRMAGLEGGSAGVDDDFFGRGFEGIGAWIIGRNMFGPVRGAWGDDAWRGWWGETPPFGVPVFVLTQYPRASFAMAGGTAFHFVTGGIEAAWRAAGEAAGGKDVRLGGGVATLRGFLQAGLVDEMHLAVVPVMLGAGEALFEGISLPGLGYECSDYVASAAAAHVVIARVGR